MTSFGRRLIGGAAVVAASLVSVFSAKSLQKPLSGDAPAYRQKGPQGARVAIVEFSDFQCPACRRAEPQLQTLFSLYGKDVHFVFKHFPLEQNHKWARTAAIAAECVGRQGKFWPYHDLLYARQDDWVESPSPSAVLLKFAMDLGVDEAAFKACVSDPSVTETIDQDIKEGAGLWIGSTPTFFINRKRFAGAAQLGSRGTPWIDKILKNK